MSRSIEASPGQTRRRPLLRISLNAILFALAGSVVLIDAIWVLAGHFDVDAKNYALLSILIVPLVAGAWFYENMRKDPPLSAMLAGAAFLLAFSASCSLLSYLLVTIAGTRIDAQLAAVDHALGFSWPAVMTFAANHKLLTALLGFAYLSVTPQTAAMLLTLGWRRQCDDIYGLCLAIAIGGLICVSVWAIHPSFGAFSVFDLPQWAAAKLGLALDGDYGRDLVLLLKNGPGHISPTEIRGIVGFPSYHTVQALVLIWYARGIPIVRWISLALNIAVIAATPIHGGHHLIDIFGGAAVAIAAIVLSHWIFQLTSRAAPRSRTSMTALPQLS
jgi:hypothetical protein